jgi:hypothetical protein
MIMFSVSACSSQTYALRAVRYVSTTGPKEMPVQISLPPKAEVAVDDCELVPVETTDADCEDVAVVVTEMEAVLLTDDVADDVAVVLAVVTSQSRNTPALASVMASFSLLTSTVQLPPASVISSPFRQPTVPSIPGKPSRCDISRISLFTAVAVAAHALKGDTVIEDSPPTASWLQLTDPIESLS